MNAIPEFLDRHSVVLFQEEPDSLRHAYQTIAEPATTTGFDILACEAKVREQLDAIETAAREGRLSLYRRRNQLTGAPGLLLGEGLQPGDQVLAVAFAEQLAEWPNELNDLAKGRFLDLRWCALHSKLSVVFYAPEPGGSQVAFASTVESRSDGMLHFGHYARLLLAESDTSQWSERRCEYGNHVWTLGGGRLSAN